MCPTLGCTTPKVLIRGKCSIVCSDCTAKTVPSLSLDAPRLGGKSDRFPPVRTVSSGGHPGFTCIIYSDRSGGFFLLPRYKCARVHVERSLCDNILFYFQRAKCTYANYRGKSKSPGFSWRRSEVYRDHRRAQCLCYCMISNLDVKKRSLFRPRIIVQMPRTNCPFLNGNLYLSNRTQGQRTISYEPYLRMFHITTAVFPRL